VSAKLNVLDRLRDCIVSLDSECVRKTTKEAMEMDIAPAEIISEGISKGSEIIGRKFENGEYFLSELMIAGELMKEALRIVRSDVEMQSVRPVARVIIGTVEGDIHDIGKNILIMFLESRGFEVVDLGVDVSIENFVRAVEEYRPQILAMSALMTHTAPVMGDIIGRLSEGGLRKKVRIIIGGAPTSPEFGEMIGADYQTTDALKGVEKCIEWTSAKDDAGS